MKKWYLPLSVILLVGACATPPVPPAQPGQELAEQAYTPSAAESAAPAAGAGQAGRSLGRRADVRAFIREMTARHRFDAVRLQAAFDGAYAKPDIIAAMNRPAEAKAWHAYRALFISPKRIQGGVDFWRANQAALARAERTFGVPPEIVVAIIGVETQYGGNMGKYRVLEALSTLAFDYPRRADYFRKELENFLLLTRAEGINPLTPRGSYAGAMGYGQFMPSSFLSYAVDFDGDGHRDLWRNSRDAVGSVANYFQKHGWRAGEPVAVPARVDGVAPATLISRKLSLPNRDLTSWQAQGIVPRTAVEGNRAALLLEFQGQDGLEYWLGFHNFYAITRYNHSQSYAMAVYQLSREIRQRYER